MEEEEEEEEGMKSNRRLKTHVPCLPARFRYANFGLILAFLFSRVHAALYVTMSVGPSVRNHFSFLGV